MKIVPPLVLGAVLTLAGCAIDAPTDPMGESTVEGGPATPVAAEWSPQREELAALLAALEDARERVLPALEPAHQRQRIDARLGALSAALEAGNAASAGAALLSTRQALESPGLSAAADHEQALTRDVLTLVLARAEAMGLPEFGGSNARRAGEAFDDIQIGQDLP